MNYNNNTWLPHLIKSVPIEARKNRTSMYTIALEGWRRGLKLKFYNLMEYDKLQVRYSLTYKGNERHFAGSSGDLVTNKAFEICEDKSITNKYLANANVPIPKGKSFDKESTEKEIIKYGESLGFPLVLKPTDGSGGKGVFANITNSNELKYALNHVRNTLKYDEVIVEELIRGKEVRVYVLGDRILGAVNRRPASVVGDGENSIKKLIILKNEYRKKIPHLYFRPIKVDKQAHELLKSQNYTLDSIPKKGERVYLKSVSNISLGGDPIDVTKELTEGQRAVAINSCKAIPGLEHCGVDIMITENTNRPVVLEVNTRPGIGSHLFPIEGQAKNIPKELIDYYFPETKGIETESSNIHFDFRSIIEPLRGRSTLEVNVKPINSNKLYSKKFIVTGHLNFQRMYFNTKKTAINLGLNGFIQKVNNRETIVVVAGSDLQKIKDFKNSLTQEITEYNQIYTKDWNKEIKLGFHISNGLNLLTIKELVDKVKELEEEHRGLEKEQQRLNHRIRIMKQSRSWRLTETIRNLVNKLQIN